MPIERGAGRLALALGLLPVCLDAALAGSPYRAQGLSTDYLLVEEQPSPAPASAAAQVLPPAGELARMPYAREVEAAARHASLDAALVHAVIHVESRHRPKAVSPKGAIGLMQVLPETAARYGIADPGRSPRLNLRAGTLYLRDLMDLFDHRLELVLAAYNAGEGAVMRHAMKVPPYPETRQYVRDVLEKYRGWRCAHTCAADVMHTRRDDYLPGTRLTSIASWR